jgi:hypothetical protein
MSHFGQSGHLTCYSPPRAFLVTLLFCHNISLAVSCMVDVLHILLTLIPVIWVNIWKWSCTYFSHLPIPPHVKYDAKLPIHLHRIKGMTDPKFEHRMVWTSVRNIYTIISKFWPILGGLKFVKCVKFQSYNWLLTKVMAKKLGNNRNPGRTIVTIVTPIHGQYSAIRTTHALSNVNKFPIMILP